MFEYDDSDDLDLGEESDENRAESSEDELDIILHGSPDQRRRIQHRRQHENTAGQEGSSSEDDFEKEMNAELQETLNCIESERGGEKQVEKKDSVTESESSTAKETEKFYDDIYFDSDEEETNESTKEKTSPKRKHAIPSNDDLLYDPNMDAEDERWVHKQRQRCRPPGSQTGGDKKTTKSLPRSDAVLNCPACMTTLCRDCQRHTVYENQYRAMFVTNCVVDSSELLRFPEQKGRRKKRRKPNNNSETDSANSDDKYNPVKCQECNTVVAMYDKDEIYHFFNILTSYA